MKQGFALLDLLVSIAISSIMSTVLFTMIFQMQKSENGINEVVSTSMQSALVYERLQKDLTGIFWPQFMLEAKPAVTPEKSEPKAEAEKTSKGLPKATPKKVVGPKIAKILYSQNTPYNDLEILKECSFITSNPLQVYNDAKPRVARVIYTLVPEQEYVGSFELRRQEGAELDYETVKKTAPAFVIIAGIKALKFTYFYQDQSNDQEEETNDQSNLIKREELDYDETGEEVTDIKSLVGQVPCYIHVNLALWNDANQQDFKEFEFWFYLNAPVKKSPEKSPKTTPEKSKK